MKRQFRSKAMTRERRLMLEAQHMRDAAGKLRPCRERDALLRQARRTDTAAHINEWLASPGLRAPS